MAVRRVSLIINCGFARTSIYVHSPVSTGRQARQQMDKADRAKKFKAQFSSCPLYMHGNENTNMEQKGKDGRSLFDRDCDKVLDSFKMKWHTANDKNEYIQHFAKERWTKLSTDEKQKHSLSNCTRCYDKHLKQQDSYPLKLCLHGHRFFY